jgi:hypothetical protein
MAFNRFTNTDARESVFNDVHRDQINIQTCNLYIVLGSAEQALLLHSLGIDLVHPSSNSETLSRGTDLLPTYRFQADSAHDVAARLIVSIVQSLMVSATFDQFRDLRDDLNKLQQTLTLTGLAIRVYERTLLGRHITTAIGKETERCLGVLRALIESIGAYQRGFNSTRIKFPWSKVWWSTHDMDELASLRRELCDCQKSLGECLLVLDS